MTRTLRALCFPDPVPDRANLYDRVATLSEVLESLRYRTTVVRGGRLMGKTSLLNVLAQAAEEQGGFAMIRLAPADSRAEFMAEIRDGIRHWVDEHRRSSSRARTPEQPASSVMQFCRQIATLAQRAPGVVFVLCLDEFDSLVQDWDEREARLVLELVGHLDTMPNLPVRFLLTMSTIPDLVLNSFRSPILNQTKIVTLAPWDAQEAAKFTEWLIDSRLTLDEAAHAALFAAAGGHPYFTKALLDALLTRLPDTPGYRVVSAARVADAVRLMASSPEVDLALSNLAGVHLSADAAAVLDRAGNSPTGVNGRSLSDLPAVRQALSSLQADGLLQQHGDRYLLRIGLWREWRAVTTTVSPRLPLHRRIGRTARRVLFRRVTAYLLACAVAGPLLLATVLLWQHRTISGRPCAVASANLGVYTTYPAFASAGDQQQIHVVIVNNGKTGVTGSALASFQPGQARMGSANGTQFSNLRPGEEATLDVDFTTTVSPGWLSLSSPQVGVTLVVNVRGACQSQHWSIMVAPVPHLQTIQKVDGALLAAVLIPLGVEFIARRFEHQGHGSQANAGATKDS